MPAFLSFDEFLGVLNHSSGMLVFVLTTDCDEAGLDHGLAVEQAMGSSAAVHLMCAPVPTSPTFAFYEGGNPRPLHTHAGAATGEQMREALALATRVAELRQNVAVGATEHASTIAQTARMLGSEQLEQFPPFFRMARTLARDAWFAARQAAQGAPLLLSSDAAAARLDVCVTCASFREDRCVECGCYMLIKAHIAAMRCPLDKWPADS